MKFAFVVCNEFYMSRVMDMLASVGIDYYTRWEQAKGKGRGTEPHLGAGKFPGTNSVLMIAFEDEAPLETLIQKVTATNAEITRPDDRIRLFQLPLERMI